MACSKKNERPEGILSQAQMSEVLIDIHLLEEKVKNSVYKTDSQRVVFNHFEPLVFEKHGVDSLTYRKSLNYYLSEPAFLEKIYEAVVDSLTVREKTKRID